MTVLAPNRWDKPRNVVHWARLIDARRTLSAQHGFIVWMTKAEAVQASRDLAPFSNRPNLDAPVTDQRIMGVRVVLIDCPPACLVCGR